VFWAFVAIDRLSTVAEPFATDDGVDLPIVRRDGSVSGVTMPWAWALVAPRATSAASAASAR
jgi:hypothetical protein